MSLETIIETVINDAFRKWQKTLRKLQVTKSKPLRKTLKSRAKKYRQKYLTSVR